VNKPATWKSHGSVSTRTVKPQLGTTPKGGLQIADENPMMEENRSTRRKIGTFATIVGANTVVDTQRCGVDFIQDYRISS
jgi:hypothetical protein